MENHLEYADISWSKKLGHLFKDAEYWHHQDIIEQIPTGLAIRKDIKYYPAITILMALERLPRRVDNDHQDLCIVADSINPIWWVGYEGKELKDEIGASKKTLIETICTLIEELEGE